LKEDPYEFGDKVIGSEFIPKGEVQAPSTVLNSISARYQDFFEQLLNDQLDGQGLKRVLMMMKFFQDMYEVSGKIQNWLKPGGSLALIIGNKKINNKIIPTDRILTDLLENLGFNLENVISQKLKTNNSNSRVPWQDRTIQDEFIMIFTSKQRGH
jgi:DNA modification methylase